MGLYNKQSFLKRFLNRWWWVSLVIIVGFGLVIADFKINQEPPGFNGQRAYQDVEVQMSFGPRTPGSDAHQQTVVYMKKELKQAGWDVSEQLDERMGHPIKNIVAKRGQGKPWIILGAHYDCRFFADHDPDPQNRKQPVPGANDGASGVAVLLELARALPDNLDKEIWLLMIDAEDQGGFSGWDWSLGANAFADNLEILPQAVVIVDMVGDRDLNIYYEKNSDGVIMREIWNEAAEIGYQDRFIPTDRFSMIDDHIPFKQKGIPAVDIIDFNYPFWHTTADTIDKITADSLQTVGSTLYNWLLNTRGDWSF